MKILHLFDIYRSFSEKDIAEFKKYLKSPFLVNNASLYEIFEKALSDLDIFIESDSKNIILRLSRKLNRTIKTVKKQISHLSNVTINFINIRSFLNDKIISGINMNESLFNNKYFSILEKNLNKISLLIKNTKEISDKTLINSFYSNIHNLNFLIQNTRFANAENSKNEFSYLKDALRDILLYSIIQLTEIYSNYVFLDVNSGNKNQYLFPLNLFRIYQEYDKTNIFTGNNKREQIYQLYRDMFLAFHKKGNIKHFINYKRKVEEISPYLSKELLSTHYQILINFCMMNERRGIKVNYYRKYHNQLLFNFINSNYYKMKRDDYLTSTVFRNFVLSAYSAGDYELLRSFIENNSSKLKPSDYNDMLNFGYAYYYLGLKKYRKVFKGINNIMINNFIYKFDIRNIELRIYYETNKIELLSGIIHNYHKAVINDKMLTKTDKDRLFKLLKYFNKLITLKNNLNINKRMKEADYYVNLLEKEPSWGMKKWLIEKFNELKKPDRVEVKRTKAANK